MAKGDRYEIEIENCATLELAFEQAIEQARDRPYQRGEDMPYANSACVELIAVRRVVSMVHKDYDRDTMQTFVFKVTEE